MLNGIPRYQLRVALSTYGPARATRKRGGDGLLSSAVLALSRGGAAAATGLAAAMTCQRPGRTAASYRGHPRLAAAAGAAWQRDLGRGCRQSRIEFHGPAGGGPSPARARLGPETPAAAGY